MSKQRKFSIDRSIIIWVLCVILLGVASVYAFSDNAKPDEKDTKAPEITASMTDAEKFAAEYTEIGANNRFVYAAPEEVLQMFEDGDGIVFLGFPECPWCQKLAPIVNEAARAEGLEKIYYLNIRTARAENSAFYRALVKKLAKYLEKDEDGNPRMSVPDVTALRDGEIVGRFKQEKAEEGVTSEAYWTQERRRKAVEQLRGMILSTNEFAAVQAAMGRGAVLLDVRAPREHAAGNFKGSTGFPLADLEAGELPSDIAKKTKLYVYGRTVENSARAAEILKDAGYVRVVDLGGVREVEEMGGALGRI